MRNRHTESLADCIKKCGQHVFSPTAKLGLHLVLSVAMLLLSWSGSSAAEFPDTNTDTDIDFSPLLRLHSEAGVNHWRMAGPLFEFRLPRNQESDMLMAMPRPLFVRFRDHAGEFEGWDALWPLAASRRRGDGHYTYILNFFHSRKPADWEVKRQRWWLWPMLFFGRDNQGRPYAAIFPLGGTVANVGFAERAFFLLFPLYLKTERGDMVEQSLLWPIFSYGRSPRVRSWRIFPVYGEKRSERHHQFFVLWPLFHMARSETDKVSSRGFFLFPLYGDIRQHDRGGILQARSRTLLWPFFKLERSPLHDKLHLPWPFFQREDYRHPLEAGEKRYYWPIYGHRTGPGTRHRFLLWPFFHHWQSTGPRQTTHIKWIAPLWLQTRRIDLDTKETDYVSHRFWPLFRQQRQGDTNEFIALNLWPTPTTPAIARNYAPLWQLYRYYRSPEEISHRLLWGLWSYRRTEEGSRHRLLPLFDRRKQFGGERRWSLLGGLIGFTKGPETPTRTRLFWFINL